MPITMQHEQDNIYRLEISGMLQKNELDRVQDSLVAEMKRIGAVKLLFVLSNFEGWERTAGLGRSHVLREARRLAHAHCHRRRRAMAERGADVRVCRSAARAGGVLFVGDGARRCAAVAVRLTPPGSAAALELCAERARLALVNWRPRE